MRTFLKARTILLALLLSIVPASSFAGVFVSITVAPPALPVYVQPPCPTPGYLWTPGYWAYGPAGYYWVPGVWLAPPAVGLLWTPGYWGFVGGIYSWHAGYWGPHVGFYGGVNYGFGYPGSGFIGGRWTSGRFFYNTAVMHVNNTVIHNTYVDRTVIRNRTVNRASFNGPGGINARPTAREISYSREQHVQATSAQMSHERMASSNRGNFASVNRGRPGTPAMSRPAYNGGAARGNGNSRPAYNNGGRPTNNTRPAYNAGGRPGNNSRPAYNNGGERGNANSRPAQNRPEQRPQENRGSGGGGNHHDEGHGRR
jgi:hypothetical protein